MGLLAILLVYLYGMPYSEASRVLDDVYAISLHEHPHRFLHLISAFRAMLESAGRLTRYDMPVHNLVSQCGFPHPKPGGGAVLCGEKVS